MKKKSIEELVRPEVFAGGYTRDDGTIAFYMRIQSLLKPQYTVLDLGAGRGLLSERISESFFPSIFFKIRGKVKRLIGADIDEIVKTNPLVDEAVIYKIGEKLPLPDQSVDLIICDWVFEHIENVEDFISDIERVLKKGGWVCARTPNKYSYYAIAASFIPKRLEEKVLNVFQPRRSYSDVFPKFYRLNTIRALNNCFKSERWNLVSIPHDSLPAYHANSILLLRILQIYQLFVRSGHLIYAQLK